MIKEVKKHRLKLELIDYINKLRWVDGSYTHNKKLFLSNGHTLYTTTYRPKVLKFFYNRLDLKFREALEMEDITEILINRHPYRYKIVYDLSN